MPENKFVLPWIYRKTQPTSLRRMWICLSRIKKKFSTLFWSWLVYFMKHCINFSICVGKHWASEFYFTEKGYGVLKSNKIQSIQRSNNYFVRYFFLKFCLQKCVNNMKLRSYIELPYILGLVPKTKLCKRIKNCFIPLY